MVAFSSFILRGFSIVLCLCLLILSCAIYAGTSSEINSKIHFSIVQKNAQSIVSRAAFFKPESRSVSGFEQLEGFEIGLTTGFMYGVRDYTDPFWIGRGTASGDYDKDGWQDILLGTDNGFVLYKNVNGHFKLQPQPSTQLEKFQVYAVALVDLNNDGWLDIFFTTFNNGNYLIQNNNGQFDFHNPVAVPNNNGVLTLSPSFADLDLNGQLDILNGNIALGVVTGMNLVNKGRNNSIVFNGGLVFRDVAMETSSGETMASLISDINNDNIPDIYFGNDFTLPDKILLGTGDGFQAVTGNQFIAYTPFFSMGADTGDINNDLSLDFVIMGTMSVAHTIGKQAIDGKKPVEYSQYKGGVKTCSEIKDSKYRENCLRVRQSRYIETLEQHREIDISTCHTLDGMAEEVCLTEIMWHLITRQPSIDNCKATFDGDEKLQSVCQILRDKGRRFERRDLYFAIPQDDRNMLYTFDQQSGAFKPVKEFQHPGGWTWNSKIVDLDNDGWQDVINSDGAVRHDGYGWNVFMKNVDGKRFEQRQFSNNLTSSFGLYSFSLLDMDNDGDLDIIGNSAEGPVQVYRNHSAHANASVAISLQDHKGNINGIGSKVTIYYRNKQKAQIREIKASGGYMSFDPAIAYFGLGQDKEIDEIHVQWPDNATTTYVGPFNAKAHYKIERLSD